MRPCSLCLCMLDMVAQPLQCSVFYAPILCRLCIDARGYVQMLRKLCTNTKKVLRNALEVHHHLYNGYDQMLCNLSSEAGKDMHHCCTDRIHAYMLQRLSINTQNIKDAFLGL